MEEPHSPKSNEMAECPFQPQQPLVCDTFKNFEGLSRVVPKDGNGVEMPRGISLHTVPKAVSYQFEWRFMIVPIVGQTASIVGAK